MANKKINELTRVLPADLDIDNAYMLISGTGENASLTNRMSFADMKADILADVDLGTTPPYSATKTINQKLNESIALDDGRLPSDVTDDAALQRLIDQGYRSIHLRGGKGLGPGGMYLIGCGPWTGVIPGRPANSTSALDYIENRGNLSTTAGVPAHGLHLFGDGPELTVIFQGRNNYLFMHNSLSENPVDNLKGFYLSDLTLKGDNSGAANGQHLVALAGVTGFSSHRVHYIAFNSDAVIAWMGSRPDTVRHNYNFHFVEDVYDGIDGRNRNAISIEDCLNWTIHRCLFRNITAPDDNVGVAAIDIEPRDRVTYQNGGGTVSDCTFEDCGRSAVSLYINSPDYYNLKTRSFRIIGNNMTRCFRGIEISGSAPVSETVGVRQQIIIAFNQMRDVEAPARLRGAFGVDYIYNQHDNVGTIYLGLDNTGITANETRIDHNYFSYSGRTLGAVLLVDDSCRDCSFSWNRIYECGRTDNLGGWVMLARYGSVGLRLNYNLMRNRLGRIKAFAQTGDGVTTGPSSQKIGNELFDTPMNVADNFNPPAPKLGISYDYVLTGGATFGANTTTIFDLTIPGAVTVRYWKANFTSYVSQTSVITITAIPQQYNVVRVIVRNTGQQWNAPAGTTINVLEDI
jgi:hypothetical protein